MELRHLRYFVALAECLSFTRAAERVHVTQSTLSHQIRQLEEELGHPLFDRIGKRVMQTAAGETFPRSASKALRDVEQGRSDLTRAGDYLEERDGVFDVFVLGFCMGGMQTLKAAATGEFERAVAFVNDVGLLAEEVDPHSGELLGNFPQAFSHIGLVNAAWAISQAEYR